MIIRGNWMIFSYHVHSKWSDGTSEITEYIKKPRELGLDEIGISDHYVLTPDRSNLSWCMPIDALDGYIESVQQASGEAGSDLIVRLGLEADYLPETAGDLADELSMRPFDYIIGSVHIVDGFSIDDKAEDWAPLSQKERDQIIREYWVRIRQMAQSRIFDFAGHLDLTKKFGIYPSVDISPEIDAALDAIAGSGMAVELNTAGWYYACREQYPSSGILEGCRKRRIPVLVNDDAHTPENLGRGYIEAYRLLHSLGFKEQVSYAGRMRYADPLPNPDEG
ncbi:MAG TPA: hypothetical protein DCL60_07930 [Armatimonadetes bacterium]|nr:hypothetical protein [Armatimonadota bacterium]